MLVYQFYLNDGGEEEEEASLIGILPERRKNKSRVTRESIMKWGELVAGSYIDPNSIYYIPLELE
jgi:hypothetical protein